MKVPNRDLLVLVKDEQMNEEEIENEVERINELLYFIESLDNICIAHEVIDMNNYKVIEIPHQVRKVLQQREEKPFQFVFNKN